MPAITRVWSRIGTKLYLALGCAVFLTLVSGAVGVWHFEQSGRHAYRVRDESVPVLEAAWQVYGHAQILGRMGMIQEQSPAVAIAAVAATLEQIKQGLNPVYAVPELAPTADRVSASATAVAGRVEDIIDGREQLAGSLQEVNSVTTQLDLAASAHPDLIKALSITRAALRAEDTEHLEQLREDLNEAITLAKRIPEDYPRLFHQVLDAKGDHLDWTDSIAQSEIALARANQTMEDDLEHLLNQSRQQSHGILTASVENFDRGRVILIAISAASVLAGVAVSWLWVGRRLLHRLSQLTTQMRRMAGGDLETPVPEMGHDEIGQLAQALEGFRQNSLEAQRLQLIESLYRQLQEASEENARMQDRLVAQAKMASMGKLVSGVAHEIGNPMNAINNLSELSLDTWQEIADLLTDARQSLNEDDRALFDELEADLNTNLSSVRNNGMRVASLLQRMQALDATGARPVDSDLKSILQTTVTTAVASFQKDHQGFECDVDLDMDDNIGECRLMARDVSEAVRNLVSNSCFAMMTRSNAENDGYVPQLQLASRLANGMIEVRVRDNGVGISAENLGRIFDPFFTTQVGQLGAGLGLYIAADVAREAGGDLTVRSEQGSCAQFTLSLPYEPAQNCERM